MAMRQHASLPQSASTHRRAVIIVAACVIITVCCVSISNVTTTFGDDDPADGDDSNATNSRHSRPHRSSDSSPLRGDGRLAAARVVARARNPVMAESGLPRRTARPLPLICSSPLYAGNLTHLLLGVPPDALAAAAKAAAYDVADNQRRCALTRRWSSVPLYPPSLDAYRAPFGDCRHCDVPVVRRDGNNNINRTVVSLRDMVAFDFDAAANASSPRTMRPASPTIEDNLALFRAAAAARTHDGNFPGPSEFNARVSVVDAPWLAQHAAASCNLRVPPQIAIRMRDHASVPLNNKTSKVPLRLRHDLTYLVDDDDFDDGRITARATHATTTTATRTTRVWQHIIPDLRLSFPTEHERCHAVGLRMLAILVAVMEKHNLRSYFVTHGSLLGAHRDGALVPWDVDIDVAMPESHMTALRRVWRTEFPRDMFLQTDRTEPNFAIYSSRRRQYRVKDRYSCFWGVARVEAHRGVRVKTKPTHQGFGIDLIPLEKLRGGAQYKILHSYFDTADLFPLSTVCLGGVMVPAPRRVAAVLTALYGADFSQRQQRPPAHFGGAGAYSCLATYMCPGTPWSLNFTADFERDHNPASRPADCSALRRDDPNRNR